MILRDMLLELNDSCEQYGMKINANKTKTMVIGRKIKKVNVRFQNEAVEKNDAETGQEQKKELAGSLVEKNRLLKDAMEGMVNGGRVRGRRRYQMIDDIR
ncbi:hypothetical protein ANN_17926 [Periplaneta americana]|uniref:FHA domain-containing protein n=1 Tax=Periplaneta americana TaxID=6978 RepID=A0ABQ8SNG9_PERAM|nr:hypothetical protein ANN_17926 [Periplaneta americana]